MVFLAVFFRESSKQKCLQPNSGVYSIETSEVREGRYEATDPQNRLVAADLEARWEEALHRREQLRHESEQRERRQEQSLSEGHSTQIDQVMPVGI
jgi:hypothetical protein